MDDDQRELLRLLKEAVNRVYAEDRFLLTCDEGNRKGLEQAFVFRTGIYLHALLAGTKFSVLDLDSEYNKNGNQAKITPRFPNGIRPDLLLHERLLNTSNKLAIEFKGWWNGGSKRDKEKLEDLTNPEYPYRYSLGVFVELGKQAVTYRLFMNGREVFEQQA